MIAGGSTWTEARDAASQSSYLGCAGHLATMTSAEENSFLWNTFGDALWDKWVGGFQEPGVVPADAGWQWVTGEAFSYTNWFPGEPNDFFGSASEQHMDIRLGSAAQWQDKPNNGFNQGYVVEYEITDQCLDTDGDGVLDSLDYCPATVIPEGVPTEELQVNRWALVDSDGLFDTTLPNGQGPGRSYSIEDTGGCSCEQIIEQMGLGNGHTQFGCSISAMDEWISYVSAP